MNYHQRSIDSEREDELDEAVFAEYVGTSEAGNPDGNILEYGQIDEINLRLSGYRKEDLEAVFGPPAERSPSGRAVWNLQHVRRVEAERFGPFLGVVQKELEVFLTVEAARSAFADWIERRQLPSS
ncbi:hypothetical protein [Nocardia aurea]|uniref:hypothetical protein n=1 Tax=Nocardia aurea TaxID=2144174 RepID=UPI000D69EBE6|nr:hypothetical protein [Nocardia aurea]